MTDRILNFFFPSLELWMVNETIQDTKKQQEKLDNVDISKIKSKNYKKYINIFKELLIKQDDKFQKILKKTKMFFYLNISLLLLSLSCIFVFDFIFKSIYEIIPILILASSIFYNFYSFLILFKGLEPVGIYQNNPRIRYNDKENKIILSKVSKCRKLQELIKIYELNNLTIVQKNILIPQF